MDGVPREGRAVFVPVKPRAGPERHIGFNFR
jgi:hypothetical protein